MSDLYYIEFTDEPTQPGVRGEAESRLPVDIDRVLGLKRSERFELAAVIKRRLLADEGARR